MKNKAEIVLLPYNFNKWEETYKGISIPQKKINNAKEIHQLSSVEKILVLIDNTTFGNAKDSVVLTDRKISITDTKLIGKNEHYFYLWDKLKKIQTEGEYFVFILQNGNKEKVKTELILENNISKKTEFIKILNEIIDEVNKKEVVVKKTVNKQKTQNSYNMNLSKFIIPSIIVLVLIIAGFFIIPRISFDKLTEQVKNPSKEESKISEKYTDQIISLDNIVDLVNQNLKEVAIKQDSSLLTQIAMNISNLKWANISEIADSANNRQIIKYETIKENLIKELTELRSLKAISLLSNNDLLLQKGENIFSFFLKRGDTLNLKSKFEHNVKYLKIKYEKTGKSIFYKNNVITIDKSIVIKHTDVITINIYTNSSLYADIQIDKEPFDFISKYTNTNFITDTILTNKNDKLAFKSVEIKMENIFHEPYKVTLSSSWDGFFGGEKRVTIPIELPKNTKEWIYRIRISEVDNSQYSDGKLFKETSEGYSEKKLFGYTVWETKSNENSLTREILNNLTKPNKEEATCNVYFINSKTEAEKFSKNLEFTYDINNSIKNTQSRNGLIKANNKGFVYLGLKNTQFKSNTYIWIEVVALLENVNYYKLHKHK